MSVRPAAEARFEFESPVIVVGAGACGLTAGLAARDAGAEVMILERDPTPRGSTSMSQGNICAAGTRLQAAAGVDDSPDIFFNDIMAKTKGQTDPAFARLIARESAPTIDWLVEKHGIPFELQRKWSGHFGHTRERIHGMPSGLGTELVGSLVQANARAGAELVTSAHVVDVYADETGRVRGIAVGRPDGSREIIGCRALILATCGFGANAGMVREFIPAFGAKPYYRYHGHDGNQGEGIRWGMDLGGAVADMAAFQGYGALADPQAILINYNMVMTGGIEVNVEGKRFSNELADISGQSIKVLEQPESRAWMVFDSIRYEACKAMPELKLAESLGALRTGATVEDLAEKIKVPPANLRATIDTVVELARGGAIDSFGRDFTANPPMQAPFHAIHVTGALFHTQGGLVVDAEARVKRPDGSALPNLFAGGGTARGISGPGVWGYIPAAGLCMAVTLGRLAGGAAGRDALSG